MNTLLLLTVFSSWNYEGFCSDPGDLPTVSSAYEEPVERPRPVPARPAPPVVPAVIPPVEPPSKTVTTPPAVPAVVKKVIPAPAPTVWQIADANGQVWKHTDAAWLRRWVESRDRTLRTVKFRAVPNYSSPSYSAPSTCTGNRCYRGR